MLKKQITSTLQEKFGFHKEVILSEGKNYRSLNKGLPRDHVSQEYLELNKIYIEDAHRWAVDSQIVSHAERMGNRLVGIVGTNKAHGIHLFSLTSFDRAFVRGVSLKPNQAVVRYGTTATLAGGILPLLKVGVANSLIYHNIGEEDEVKFESRGEPLRYARYTKEFFESTGITIV